MNEVIRLKSVSHVYSNMYTEDKVLDDINLEFEKGKLYSIMGPSGSGKTTLLNIIGGLLTPTSGKVYIGNQDITSYNKRQLAELRLHEVGFIFQNFNLVPFLTVKENILLQVRLSKQKVGKYIDKYEDILSALGIKEKENAFVHELSGGQQQRVAIARCLLMQPKIILADEPTGNLDKKNTTIVMDVIRKIQNQSDICFIIVTHDERISEYCDKTVYIQDSKAIIH